MNRSTASLLLPLLGACAGSAPPAPPPGAVLSPPDPPAKKRAASAPPPAPAQPPFNPVHASFFDVGKDKKRVEHVACETRAFAMVKGKATAAGEALAAGDVLLAQGKGGWDVSGDGLAVLAILQPPNCEPGQYTTIAKKVIRAKAAPPLSWAGGAMTAHLDVTEGDAGVAYLGRLEGTAPVAEHVHEKSWEVLCAVEAKGTLTVAGAAQALSPKTCVAVPPNTKHAWSPDAGAKLVAVQLYAPAGPEQRFKALAAQAADAGAPPKEAGAPPKEAGSPPKDAGAGPKDAGAPAAKR